LKQFFANDEPGGRTENVAHNKGGQTCPKNNFAKG